MSGQNTFGLQQNNGKSFRAIWLYLGFLLLITLAAGIWATQLIAEAYEYHPALGGRLWNNFYAPWMFLIWNFRLPASEVLSRATDQALFICFVPLAGMVLYLIMFGRKPKGKTTIHGSARWATSDEIKKMSLLDETGVYVGGFLTKEGFLKKSDKIVSLRHNGPEHILAFMPTRSGKGVGLILPSLLVWEDSSLVFDLKGENWALTAGYLKSIGHCVLKFEPADATGTGAPYNPMDEVRIDGFYAISDSQNLVQMLLDPDGKSFEGKDSHWKKNAAALLAGVLLHCMIMTRLKENRTANLCDLAYMFSDENRSVNALFEEMTVTPHAQHLAEIFKSNAEREEYKEIGRFIISAARTIMSKPAGEQGSVISTAVTDLALYKDPIVAANTSYSSWRIDDLFTEKEPVNLYLVVNPGEIIRMRPLLRIIITQIIHKQTKNMQFIDGRSAFSCKHRLLYMLDELQSLGKIGILEKAIAYIAGYGGKMYLIVQDVMQLDREYGKENALMGNCHIRIAAAPNKPEAAEFLSKMTGKTTVVEEKTSLSGSRAGHLKNASVSVQEVARPLLTPDECMCLPAAVKDSEGNIIEPGDTLIFVAGSRPIYGKQILYFKDPVFAARTKMPAPEVSDRPRVPETAPAPVQEAPGGGEAEASYDAHFSNVGQNSNI